MLEIKNDATGVETIKMNNILRLFSGLIVLLGDIVLIIGMAFGGLSFFNIPFSIDNMKDLFSDFSAFMKHFSEDYVTLEITIVLIVLVAIAIVLIVRFIVAFIRFFKLFKLKANEEIAQKNYSSFLRAAGGMYAVCGGSALCSVAVNAELPIWSFVMILLSFVYIILMTAVESIRRFPKNGVGKTIIRSAGALILCGVTVVVTLLYAKPVLTSVYDGLKNVIVYSYQYSAGEFIVNVLTWIKLLIGMAAGAMLASTVYAVSPIDNRKGNKKTGIGGFIYGIVLVILAVGASIAEMFVLSSNKAIVFTMVFEMIPLFLCSVAGLVAVEGLLKKKNA